jgi:perosamine synthetase
MRPGSQRSLRASTTSCVRLVESHREHAWHQYTVKIRNDSGLTRDQVAELLSKLGIESRVHYPHALTHYSCFMSHPQVRAHSFRQAEMAASEVLSLPVHQWLSDRDVDRVAEAVRTVIHG